MPECWIFRSDKHEDHTDTKLDNFACPDKLDDGIKTFYLY